MTAPHARRSAFTAAATLLLLVALSSRPFGLGHQPPALNLLVLDPLARQNACACVEGYAQRDYGALRLHLERRLIRDVSVSYGTTGAAVRRSPAPDVIIGKCSVIEHATAGAYVRIAMLTGQDGTTTQRGLLVVRSGDRARTTADLRNRVILLGEVDAEEKRSAMLALLRKNGILRPRTATRPTCSIASLAVVEGKADAAAISGYCLPLLTGCGTVKKGALRVVARTEPVPFVGVYAAPSLPAATLSALIGALGEVGKDPVLRRALETRDGFIAETASRTSPSSGSRGSPLTPQLSAAHAQPAALRRETSADWSDWRGGPQRTATVGRLPESLPAEWRVVWRRPMESSGVGGVSVAAGKVYCSGKTADGMSDLWLCLDAGSGRELWRLVYPAAGKMDYTSSPRAAPVIIGNRAFLLGAFGMLHCVQADTGKALWKQDLPRRFGGSVPTWGFCATPLVVGNAVIVPTGSPQASLAALDVRTGDPIWLSPGKPPGYGNPILATFGGRSQVIWHDKDSLGGWDPQTGRRLWTLKPPETNDFNVPTPVAVGGRLLVATENNGTRLYGFGKQGLIAPKPLAHADEARPETASPVVVDGVAWVASQSGLYALDLRNGLATLWKSQEEPFLQHASIIGAPGRVLIVTLDGTACLMPSRPSKAARPELRKLPFSSAGDDADDVSVWSHPAVAGDRLYVRSNRELLCIALP